MKKYRVEIRRNGVWELHSETDCFDCARRKVRDIARFYAVRRNCRTDVESARVNPRSGSIRDSYVVSVAMMRRFNVRESLS